MRSRSAPRLAVAASCLTLAVMRHAARPPVVPVVLLPDEMPAPPLDPTVRAELEPGFAERMTPDDVARGVWALAQGDGPGLSAEQVAAALPLARSAVKARADVDRGRAARRVARADLRGAGTALAAALIDLGWVPEGAL